MSLIVVDCETYSELDVRAVGAERYAAHPSTQVLMWSVRGEDWERALVYEEPNLWKLLLDLKKAGMIHWTRNEALNIIHWGPFDRLIAQAKCIHDVSESWGAMDEVGVWEGPSNTYWGDLSELSVIFGGPSKLSWAAEFWSGAETKDDGKHLISRFCSPTKDGIRITRHDDPMRWEKFRSYAAQDANVTYEVLMRIEDVIETTGERIELHSDARRVVQTMNDRGVPIDREAIYKAVLGITRSGARVRDEVYKLHGVNLNAPGKVAAFLGLPNAQKETIEEALETMIDPAQIKVAEGRLIVSGAANKKLATMENRALDDGRVRGCFLYSGAWTRRMTSLGVQFQNLVRSKVDYTFFDELYADQYADSLDVFNRVRNNIRGFIKAPPGKIFVAADYAQIELRVAAWLAGEEWLVEALHHGEDVYKITAGNIYHKPAMSVDGHERQMGKTVELASQFGLSPTGLDGDGGLFARLTAEGIETTKAECKRIIGIYRATHPRIVQAWEDFENAVYILVGAPVGTEVQTSKVLFRRVEHAIIVERPSGFRQYLWFPRIVHGHWPDGGEKETITYTGRSKSGQMTDHQTYGGKIFQGVVQGIAADILYVGMHRAEHAGYELVMSVHDEIVTEIEKGSKSDPVVDLCELICIPTEWSAGLPLRAEGWMGERFTK